MKRGARRYLLTLGRRGVSKVRVPDGYELKLGEIESDTNFMPQFPEKSARMPITFIKLRDGDSWAIFPANCGRKALGRLLSVPPARRAELVERDPTKEGVGFLLESMLSYPDTGAEEAAKLGVLVGQERDTLDRWRLHHIQVP